MAKIQKLVFRWRWRRDTMSNFYRLLILRKDLLHEKLI